MNEEIEIKFHYISEPPVHPKSPFFAFSSFTLKNGFFSEFTLLLEEPLDILLWYVFNTKGLTVEKKNVKETKILDFF